MKCCTRTSGCASRCLCAGLLLVAGVAVAAWVVMLLWNCLLPDLFAGVSRIGYGQAIGVLLLSRILFGGLRGGHPGRWRERQMAWQGMTPEERQRFKARWPGRWRACCAASAADGDEAGAKPAGDA